MKYETIIFDLGAVLINLDTEASFKRFQSLVKNIDPHTFNGKVDQLPFYSDFEVGKINSEILVERFNSHHQSDLSLAEFTVAWNLMILNFSPEKIELVRKLRARSIRVLLLSNINEIHEKKVDERFAELGERGQFRDLFNHAYYSHRIGKRKPNIETFEYVLKDQHLDPQKTLFIDDGAQHIRAARTLGIECIHLTDPGSLINLEVFQGLK